MVEEALTELSTVESFISNYRSAHLRIIATVSALVILILEFFLHFEHECRFVWRKPRITPIKLIYLISRYIAILTQIANLVAALHAVDNIPVPKYLCKSWFLFHMTTSTGLLFALDAVLMIRVYALYNCNPKIGLFLSILFITQVAVVSIFAWRSSDIPLSMSCNITTKIEILAPATAVVIAHISIWAMTIHKRKVITERSPVLDLVVRDGTWMFLFVFSVITATIPYSLVVDYAESHVVFIWPTTFFSVFACRLVLNMRNLGTTPSDVQQSLHLNTDGTSPDFVFTSCIQMSNQGQDTPNPDSTSGNGFINSTEEEMSRSPSGTDGPQIVRRNSVVGESPSPLFGVLLSRVTLSDV